MMKKKVVILGSTGSIGVNALKVISRYPEHFEVLGLSAYDNVDLLQEQAKTFLPKYVAISRRHIEKLKLGLKGSRTRVLDAEYDLPELAAQKAVDIVVMAMSGSAALEPFLSAVKAGKQVAPANKEALVIAGELIMALAQKSGARIIPVDSEQSAIFQCLEGRERKDLKKILLTASGGALWKIPQAQFDRLTIEDILRHPRWDMGKKITVDSASMMNKGFEVIEAQRLFGVQAQDIEVVIHPEAIVHSMVSFKDGSILAQLGVTDMRLPIQYALTYPQRWDTGLKDLDLTQLGQLHFYKPDFKKFPCLALALHVAKTGGTLPAVLNAADEVAVNSFLAGHLAFNSIYKVVEKVVSIHKTTCRPSLGAIREADGLARQQAQAWIKKESL